MIYTGIDGEKWISVNASLIRKEWKITHKRGKPIYAFPSDISLIRIERTSLNNLHDLKRALSIELEEKFGKVLWDVSLKRGVYCLSLLKIERRPEDAYSLEPEPFSLARICKALGTEDCYVVDIGRRKTTLVEVREGELSSFRVVLKGGDFITQSLASEEGIPFEEAEKKKMKEGAKNEAVREAMKKILTSLGVELSRGKVLLSGGGSRLKGIEELLEGAFKNHMVAPEMNTALGASLKFVYRDCSPDFREEEISDRELKRVGVVLGLSLLLFLGTNLGLETIKRDVVREVRKAEREAFKETFPNLPAVSVRDQVKAMSVGPRYPMLEKLYRLSESLTEGLEIYRIEYREGKLVLSGSAQSEEALSHIGAKTIRRTPEGNFLFEVEVE